MKDEKKQAANLGGKQNPQQPGQPHGGQQQPKQPQQNWQKPGTDNRGNPIGGGNMGGSNLNKNKDQDRNKF